ncbi:MAG: hypothetical protein U1F43_07145 [Myxococcota bacterium]
MAPLILPHVRERPLSLVRCPDGVRGSCFYQSTRTPACLRASRA